MRLANFFYLKKNYSEAFYVFQSTTIVHELFDET